MARPSYKKLYTQEKARRELYEQWDTGLVGKYDEYIRRAREIYGDIEAAVLVTHLAVQPRNMKGLLHYITPANPAQGA